jgi:hypothetical protein
MNVGQNPEALLVEERERQSVFAWKQPPALAGR